MADERVRRSKKQAAVGDLAAEAQFLVERVRTGELPSERLRLAALLGAPAAIAASGVDPDYRLCGKGLANLAAESPEHFVRLGLGFIRVLRPPAESRDDSIIPTFDALLGLTQRWLGVQPAVREALLADDFPAVGGPLAANRSGWITAGEHPERSVMLPVSSAFNTFAFKVLKTSGKHRSGRTSAINSLRSALRSVTESLGPNWDGERRLHEELAPWILGLDPPPLAKKRKAAKKSRRRSKKSRESPMPQCVCTGCRGCHGNTRCPTRVRAAGRDRCSKCWKIHEESERMREYFEGDTGGLSNW